MDFASQVILYIVAFPLVVKLAWNASVGLHLVFRNPQETGSVSLMPGLEVALWFLLLGLAALLPGDAWMSQPLNIIVWGAAAIIVSYALLWVLGAIAAFFLVLCGKREFA